MKRTMSGAQILLECLKLEGVDTIFGYPGGAVLPIYDALYDCPELQHILVRHEQGAAHAAEGYAQATGQVGVCLATSGPGATNLVTGIADAMMDSVPIVAITGQVRTAVIGKDAFQETNTIGITAPISKINYQVRHTADLPATVAEAFYLARSGRPRPTLIDVPVDISNGKIEWSPDMYERPTDSPPDKKTFNDRQICEAARAIREAKRPILYVGGGAIISYAQKEVTELSERTNILVTTTLKGKGAIDEEHPHALGMLGMHGSAYANYAVHNCDLLIAVGARFDDRVTGKVDRFAPYAKIIHIDIDPKEINKVKRADIPIIGDVKQVLGRLLKYVEPRPWSEWNDRIMEWKARFPFWYPRDGRLRAEYIIEQIGHLTDRQAIMTTDVGQHQMWAAQWYKCRRARQWITSGGLGTMGFGLPAAIGAQVAYPEAVVVCLTGDGSIQMCIQELMTATVYKLPVIVAIINNKSLGMVRQWQELFWQQRYSEVDLEASPDFVLLAQAYGGVGMRITREEEVVPALQEALQIRDRPIVMDFVIPTEEKVWPMIPSGQTVEQMMVRTEPDVHEDGCEWAFADELEKLERAMREEA